MMLSVISNGMYLVLLDPFDADKEKTVNILRLNQQEIIQTKFSTPEINDAHTSVDNTSKPIFSLSPNTSRDDLGVSAPNSNNSGSTGVQGFGIPYEGNMLHQPVSRNNNVVFCPKKFVPAQKKDDIIESNIDLDTNLTSNNDKIKPKWSPGVTSQEIQPKYKKIQPIFQKPKSPHKIT